MPHLARCLAAGAALALCGPLARTSSIAAPAPARADLLVLDANPLDRIASIRRLRYVMKDGSLVERSALWRAAGPRE